MRLTLVDRLLLGTLATSLLAPVPARGHSWYPQACCSGKDCARVEKIELVPAGRMVTTKHGTILVPVDFQARESEDSDFHACISKGDGEFAPVGELSLTCWFEPKGS